MIRSRSVVLIKQMVVQPRICFVSRPRAHPVRRSPASVCRYPCGEWLSGSRCMVRQFKPDPVGVTDTRDAVLAVALKRDAVAGGVTHPAQHIHPVTGAVCQAIIAGIVSHRWRRRIPGRCHKRSDCSVHHGRTVPGNRRGGAGYGAITVNRRITVTVEGKVQRGSLADDIHPVSLFTHPGDSLQESLQPTPVRPCSGSTELWKRVKERGGSGPECEVGTFVAYAPVTGSTGLLPI